MVKAGCGLRQQWRGCSNPNAHPPARPSRWKAQSAAYLARPNAATRAELARLRARPDMFVYLTERQQGQVGERQALRVPFPLPPGSIHIHVRHGRKAGEMELVALATYVKAAEHWLVNFNPLAYKKVGASVAAT